MCLGLPMQIVEIDGGYARCEAKGVERRVCLFLVQDESLVAGDYIVVHVGYALQKITATQARTAWEHYDVVIADSDENKAIEIADDIARINGA
ncbi:MAG: HypC/HybG/HupF family hydrogenase formation chaperone [Rhodospirillaceae bacterium]